MNLMNIPAGADPNNVYLRTKIYKITHHSTTDVYVGSTYERRLKRRFDDHVRCYRAWLAGVQTKPCNMGVFDLLKLGQCTIELIEEYPCQTNTEKLTREQYWIDMYCDTCVNKLPAKNTRTPEEQKEVERERQRKYVLENKEKVSTTHAEYQRTHRDEIAAYQSNYQEANRDKLQANARKRVPCECGAIPTKDHLASHRRSKTHADNMNRLQAIDHQAALLQLVPLRFIEKQPIIPAVYTTMLTNL